MTLFLRPLNLLRLSAANIGLYSLIEVQVSYWKQKPSHNKHNLNYSVKNPATCETSKYYFRDCNTNIFNYIKYNKENKVNYKYESDKPVKQMHWSLKLDQQRKEVHRLNMKGIY